MPTETLNLKVHHDTEARELPYSVTDENGAPAGRFANPDDAYEFRRRKTETPDQAVDRAMNIIRRDYHDDVHNAAVSIQEELTGRLKEQECGESLREWLIEHIDQEIDGSARVIYTQQAQLGVLSSDNDGAYFEEFGDEGAVSDGAIDWSKLCYAAMRADVAAELERLDVDVNNPVPECGECDADDQEERWEVGEQWLCTSCKDEAAKAAAIEHIKTLTLDQCRALCLAHGITLDEPAELEAVRAGLIDDIAARDLDPAKVSA